VCSNTGGGRGGGLLPGAPGPISGGSVGLGRGGGRREPGICKPNKHRR